MTSQDDLDRRLTARLDERAAPRAPRGLTKAIDASVARTRQRPSWATTERWIPMQTRAQFGAVPRAVIAFATLALLTALAAGAIAIGSSTGPTLPPPFGAAANGLIAFELDGDIWVVDPASGDRRQITSGAAGDSDPSWSRDGTRLAFLSTSAAGDEVSLVVTDADGREPMTIATTPSGGLEMDAWIEWSADSSEIMYNAVDPDLGSAGCPYPPAGGGRCGSRLYVVPVDGSAAPRRVGDPDLDARSPALSPDGATVAFGGGEAGSEALYLMAWDGSNVRRLDGISPTTAYWAFAKQSWSADGQKIVTHDDQDEYPQRIWLVEADGSGATQISEGFGHQLWPDYAPDGSAILWASSEWSALWTPDGGQAVLPIAGGAWSPDARRFVTVRAGALRVTDRRGEILAELGPADGEASGDAWQRVAP